MEIWELHDSPVLNASPENPGLTTRWGIRSTNDELEAYATCAGAIPAIYIGPNGPLQLQGFALEPQGCGLWFAEATYAKKEPKKPGDSTFSFDIGGSSAHITQAAQHIARYPAAAPDCKGAIGVNGDTVEGVDIDAPTYDFSETHILAGDLVTPAYKATLFEVRSAPVNNAPFRGFQAGEVKFMGASGSKRGEEDWEVSYKFSASKNATGITVGDITGIAKDGWDYLWVRYEEAVDEKQLIRRPIGVYIERVFQRSNFAALGIGTS